LHHFELAATISIATDFHLFIVVPACC